MSKNVIVNLDNQYLCIITGLFIIFLLVAMLIGCFVLSKLNILMTYNIKFKLYTQDIKFISLKLMRISSFDDNNELQCLHEAAKKMGY